MSSYTPSPAELRIADYTYELPEERIAKFPLAQRDQSKLLVYRDCAISEDLYRQLPEHLVDTSLLVFNNTKVVQARLRMQKATGGIVEIFCLEPFEALDITQAMSSSGSVDWKCMVGGAKKWKEGTVTLEFEGGTVQAEKIGRVADSFHIRLSWSPASLSFAEVLMKAGILPLPPYMNRDAEANDLERYQTVYAEHKGSVAAPTAGLHFSDTLLEALTAQGLKTDFVTLHVGAGTFKPVKSETMQDHDMHFEHLQVSKSFIDHLIQHLGSVGAVGTTSLRTLESLYWMGRKVLANPALNEDELVVQQWDPYNGEATPTAESALQALSDWLSRHEKDQLLTKTQLLIAPGYSFKVVDTLATNFHQPGSTLLLLVAAFIGNDWKNIYQYALDHDFRFLSYGDGCLLHRS